MSTAAPEVGMVVIQPTAFCNLDCSYCYLPNRGDKHVIAQSTITKLFTELFALGWASPQLAVIWHAGEPLVVPPDFYREAFAAVERLRPTAVAKAGSARPSFSSAFHSRCCPGSRYSMANRPAPGS